MTSRSLGSKTALRPHITMGNGKGAEIRDLRKDVDEAFTSLEAELDALTTPTAQLEWHIDADTGDDDNDGDTALTALATAAGWRRKVGAAAPHGTIVYVHTDIADTFVIQEEETAHDGTPRIKIVGSKMTVLDTGTLTDVPTDYDGTNVGTVEDTGLAVSWTASGLLDKLIAVYSGETLDGYMYATKDLGTKIARVSFPTSYAVSAGSTYVVYEDMVDIKVNKSGSAALEVSFARFTTSASCYLTGGISKFYQCQFANEGGVVLKQMTGAYAYYEGCLFKGNSDVATSSRMEVAYSGFNNGRVSVTYNGYFEGYECSFEHNNPITTPPSIIRGDSSYVYLTDSSFTDITATCLIVLDGYARGDLSYLWGAGNTTTASINIALGTSVDNYALTVAGGASDLLICGVAKAYADIPFVNSTKFSGFVE